MLWSLRYYRAAEQKLLADAQPYDIHSHQGMVKRKAEVAAGKG